MQPALAKTNPTRIYERAGYGRIGNGPLPRTSGRVAVAPRTLQSRAGLPPPDLLVGHSFDGFNVRIFASLFPDATAGIVLVDFPHEAQADALFDQGILRFLDSDALRSLSRRQQAG